jgi:hypothetical protein
LYSKKDGGGGLEGERRGRELKDEEGQIGDVGGGGTLVLYRVNLKTKAKSSNAAPVTLFNL